MAIVLPQNDITVAKDQDYLLWLSNMSRLLVPFLQYRSPKSKKVAALICAHCGKRQLDKNDSSGMFYPCSCPPERRCFVTTLTFQELK